MKELRKLHNEAFDKLLDIEQLNKAIKETEDRYLKSELKTKLDVKIYEHKNKCIQLSEFFNKIKKVSEFNVYKSQIFEVVSEAFCISKEDLIRLSNVRERNLVIPRQIIMFMANILGETFSGSGRIFGKDHATALYAKKEVLKFYNIDKNYKSVLDNILSNISFDNSAIDKFKKEGINI